MILTAILLVLKYLWVVFFGLCATLAVFILCELWQDAWKSHLPLPYAPFPRAIVPTILIGFVVLCLWLIYSVVTL